MNMSWFNVNPDTALVIGIVISVLAIPAIVSAISDARAPRVAALAILIGGGLIIFALANEPGGYAINDVPKAFARVIAQFL